MSTRVPAEESGKPAPTTEHSVVPTPPVYSSRIQEPPAPQPLAPLRQVPPPLPTGRRATRGRIIAGTIILLLIAGVFFALRPRPLQVETAYAAVRPMRVTVDADAVSRVRAHFTVTSPVTGLARRLELREGDPVKAGEVVAFVTTPPAHPTEQRISSARLDAANAAQAQAEARVRQAVTALAQAERDASRVRRLAEAGALAPRDAETASVNVASRRADVDAARAQVRVAEADLKLARAGLDAVSEGAGTITPVKAPAAGRVLRIPEQSARVVTAGTPLLEIGDPASLEVAADVLSSDAAQIRPGQEVVLHGWGGDPLRGRVRLVEPSARTRISALGVEEQRLTVVIDLIDAPPALGDGYRLEASTVVWQGRDVLTVPSGALMRSSNGWNVYAVVSGRARRVPIRVGHVGGGYAEVLSGVKAGDVVIAFPSDEVHDGVRVRR